MPQDCCDGLPLEKLCIVEHFWQFLLSDDFILNTTLKHLLPNNRQIFNFNDDFPHNF